MLRCHPERLICLEQIEQLCWPEGHDARSIVKDLARPLIIDHASGPSTLLRSGQDDSVLLFRSYNFNQTLRER